MSSLFGEVWFWSLLAFLLGALITWVLLVRPLQQRVNQLEQQLQQANRPSPHTSSLAAAPPAEPDYRQPEKAEWPGTPASAAPAAPAAPAVPAVADAPPTRWLEQDSLPKRSPQPGYADEQPESTHGEDYDEDYDEAAPYESAPYQPAPYEPATAAVDPQPEPYEPATAAVEPRPGPYEPATAAVEPRPEPEPSGLFDPAQPFADDLAARLDGAEPALDPLDPLDVGSAVTRRVRPEAEPWPEAPTQVQPHASQSPAAPPADAVSPAAASASADTPAAADQEDDDFEPEEFTRRVPPRSGATPKPVVVPAQPAADEPSFFEDEQPTTSLGPDGQLPDIEPDFDPETGLPKRTRGASTHIRGGFEPPRPIQPSVRPIARRTPQPDAAAVGGSLFEPSAAGEAVKAPGRAQIAEQREVPPGPFGPGSAMPLPGGGRPGPDFTVKGSVTALRYCPEESARFSEMVAEVWFASAADAERVGFRPLGA